MTTLTEHTERELAVLQAVQANETAPQRDIARSTGMSLGMTNAVLKRLSQKGFVTIRRVKGRHMRYAVTPDGVHEIAKRTYRYFRRTMRHVTDYKERIDDLVAAAARDGYHTVVLAGESDLAFLVEHACIHEGLTFLREPKQDKQNNKVPVSSHAPERPHGAFRLVGEAAPDTDAETSGDAWLWQVIQGHQPGAAHYE